MSCRGEECPVRPAVENVIRLGTDMTVALSRMKRDLNQCETCLKLDGCQLRGRFNADILAAITQITEEWNLGEAIQHG